MPSGLDPVATSGARMLVLGTLPGRISLQLQQYYANDRNAFWFVAEQLLGIPRDLPYASRIERLGYKGVALWDVLESAEREGSLDSKIIRGTEVPNDIVGFLREHPAVNVILLNGSTAGKLFERLVRPTLVQAGLTVPSLQLPSTSPANTRCTLASKVESWVPIAEVLRGT